MAQSLSEDATFSNVRKARLCQNECRSATPRLKSALTPGAQLILRSTVPSFTGTALSGGWLAAGVLGTAACASITRNAPSPIAHTAVLVFIGSLRHGAAYTCQMAHRETSFDPSRASPHHG